MKSPPSPMLVVSHHIFLTRQERYALINHEETEVVGVSLPVWFSTKHTCEPAEEVFCKYLLIHDNEDISVECMGGGYKIHVPSLSDWTCPEPPDDEKWLAMNNKELSNWYKKASPPQTVEDLKDIKDGGGEYLKFKYLGSLQDKEQKIHTMHYCVIKSLEMLTDTLI